MNKERLLKNLNIIAEKEILFKTYTFIEATNDASFCWLCRKNFIDREIILNDKFGGLPLCFLCFKCFLNLNNHYKLRDDFIKLIDEVNKFNVIIAL